MRPKPTYTLLPFTQAKLRHQKSTAVFPKIKVSYEVEPGEEWPMSYVIGMKCTDGILLASDQKMTSVVGVRQGYRTHKMDVFESENMAFCSAGDDLCMTFIQVVREKLQNNWFCGKSFGELKQILIQCVYETRTRDAQYRTAKNIGPEVRELVGGNTFVVLREPAAIQLWSVNTHKAVQYPNPLPIDTCCSMGDAGNPAIFFTEHYYNTAPARTLLPLAVHTVLMAKNDFVDGVDIGIFTQSEFRVLAADELREAIEKSKQIDSSLAQTFGAVTSPKTTA